MRISSIFLHALRIAAASCLSASCVGGGCREKELASVRVSAADIDLILTEVEVDHKAADRRLREHGGNIHLALKSFLYTPG